MATVLLAVANKDLDVVLNTTWTSLIISTRLDGDGGRRLLRHLKGEGEGIGAQLLDEAVLQSERQL